MSLEKDAAKQRLLLFLPLLSFLLAFNYFILKSVKETLLVTSPGVGAEAIPFVRIWLLFPLSLGFLGFFTWSASRFSLKTAVFSAIASLLLFYTLFAFILYPLGDAIHLHTVADQLETLLPAGWKAFAAVIRYWSYSLFYVAAECWCTVIYSVVFWGYANAVIRFSEAARCYPRLTLAGTTAALVAGPLLVLFTNQGLALPFGKDPWEGAFYGMIFLVVLFGGAALWVFYRYCPGVEIEREEKKQPFLSSVLQTFRSRYLLVLAAICFSYNLVINLSDVIWKNEVLRLYPSPSDYTGYLSKATVFTGIISTILTLFFTRRSIQRLGWTKTALITPATALVTGSAFFCVIFYRDFFFPLPSLELIAFLGSLHICLSTAARYTLFEPAKEMAFIPLPGREKLQGKATIDGIGVRFGKTSSSLFYQVLLIALPSVSSCTPLVALVAAATIGCSMLCIQILGKQIEQKTVEA